jgi:hypothetical protein
MTSFKVPAEGSAADRRAYAEWLDLCKRIEDTTALGAFETPEQKDSRKKRLQGDFVAFCKYYFADFIDADFGWFHKKAIAEIEKDKTIKIVLEWPREHAKSIFADVFTAMYLYARGEVDGLLLISNTFDKAKVLLGDLQAQFVSNVRFINDYGDQAKNGSWTEGNFMTTEGVGFWAMGRGQSARGIRRASKRPNICFFDDMDDDSIIHNETLVDKALDWALKSVYPAMSLKGFRAIWLGNRIAKRSILAKYVGDYEIGKPIREGIVHIKVFAIENPRTHAKADFNNGRPAWKERYTLEQLKAMSDAIGRSNFGAEYMHEHLTKGKLFKPEWQYWFKTPPLKHFDGIVTYGDSSLGEKSDYKAVFTLGIFNLKYGYPYKFHVLDVFCQQTTSKLFVNHFFEMYERYRELSEYWIESNALQKHGAWKLLKQDFEAEEKIRGYVLPIRPDDTKKANKEARIEAEVGIFERGIVSWAEEKRGKKDFDIAWEQFTLFPEGKNDDAPDAFVGAKDKVQKRQGHANFRPRTGRYQTSDERRIL